LPVAKYNYVSEFADTSIAALSVMYIAATAALIAFATSFLGLGKVLNIEQTH
jgi:putative spermidine/putrescine transport system permease protein